METWLGVALSHRDNEHFLAGWAVPSPGEVLALGAGWGRVSSPSEAGQPLATGRQEAAGAMAGTWLAHPLRLSFCLCEMGINTVPIARGR